MSLMLAILVGAAEFGLGIALAVVVLVGLVMLLDGPLRRLEKRRHPLVTVEPQKALPPGPSAREAAPEAPAEQTESRAGLPSFGTTMATFYLPEAGTEPLDCIGGHELAPGEVFWPVPVGLPDEPIRMLAVCTAHVQPRARAIEAPEEAR